MPKDRIARIKSYFAEDNAVTLDGLFYPKEAIDALLASIHQQLADPNGLPIPCYLSHDDADSGNIAHLVGKVSGAGREGSKGYVWVDVPDTQAGREMLTLARGKYITSHHRACEAVAAKCVPVKMAQFGLSAGRIFDLKALTGQQDQDSSMLRVLLISLSLITIHFFHLPYS